MRENNSLEDQIIKLKDNIVKLSSSSLEERNNALSLIKEGLIRDKNIIFAANKKDLDAAKSCDISNSIVSRLKFNEKKENNTSKSR